MTRPPRPGAAGAGPPGRRRGAGAGYEEVTATRRGARAGPEIRGKGGDPYGGNEEVVAGIDRLVKTAEETNRILAAAAGPQGGKPAVIPKRP